MSNICHACDTHLAQEDKYIACSGRCGRIFHQSCVLNKTQIASWSARVGLIWLCATCRLNFDPAAYDQQKVIMKALRELLIRMDSMDTRLGSYGANLRKINQALNMSKPDAAPTEQSKSCTFAESIEHLNLDQESDMLERSRSCEETSFFEVIDEINSTIAQVPERFQVGARKRVQINPQATSSAIKPVKQKNIALSSSPKTSEHLNGEVAASRLKVAARDVLPDDEVAFYITPFTPDQAEGDIKLHVCEVTNCESFQVKVTKLVPRARNLKELTFVSFKVTIPKTVADIVKDKWYWPEGINVRPFQPHSKNDPQLLRLAQNRQPINSNQ